MPIKDILEDALNFFHLKSNFYFIVSFLYIGIFILFELLPGNNLFFSYTIRYEDTYSSLDFLVTLIYIIYDTLYISFCAVWIHNTLILGYVHINKIFVKKLIHYSIFVLILSLVTERTFISGFFLHFADLGKLTDNFFMIILITYSIFVIPGIVISILSFLWILYMPNLALGDGVSFFKFFKISKGYRWSIFKIILIQLLIVILFYLISDIWFSNKPIFFRNLSERFGDIFVYLFVITCLSSLYKKFRKDVLNLI